MAQSVRHAGMPRTTSRRGFGCASATPMPCWNREAERRQGGEPAGERVEKSRSRGGEAGGDVENARRGREVRCGVWLERRQPARAAVVWPGRYHAKDAAKTRSASRVRVASKEPKHVRADRSR